MTGTVLTERRGHVLLMGLNRPDNSTPSHLKWCATSPRPTETSHAIASSE
jgi:hypothetical protein